MSFYDVQTLISQTNERRPVKNTGISEAELVKMTQTFRLPSPGLILKGSKRAKFGFNLQSRKISLSHWAVFTRQEKSSNSILGYYTFVFCKIRSFKVKNSAQKCNRMRYQGWGIGDHAPPALKIPDTLLGFKMS